MKPLICMLEAGPKTSHYYCAVVLHSCIVLPPVCHSSNHEYHCCQLTRQSNRVSNFYLTFKLFIWLSFVHSITRPLIHASFCVPISKFSSRRPNFSEAAHTTQKVDTACCSLHWFDAKKFRLLSSVFLLMGTASSYLPEVRLSSVNAIRDWKYYPFVCSHFTIHSHNISEIKASMYCFFDVTTSNVSFLRGPTQGNVTSQRHHYMTSRAWPIQLPSPTAEQTTGFRAPRPNQIPITVIWILCIQCIIPNHSYQ